MYIYDWRPPGTINDDDDDYSYFRVGEGYEQLAQNEYLVLVRFVEWIDPSAHGVTAVRAGRATFETFLFDSRQQRMLASKRHRVDQAGSLFSSSQFGDARAKEARLKLVELVDKQIRDWLQGK